MRTTDKVGTRKTKDSRAPKAKTRLTIGRRGGVGIIAIAVVGLIAQIFLESVIVNSFIADTEVVQRSVRETAVINAVNEMEFAKIALKQSVPYSVYEAAQDVFSLGGYCSYDSDACAEDCKAPQNAPTYGCEPRWMVYGKTYAPQTGTLSDPQQGTFTYYLISRISSVYDSYANEYTEPFYTPAYCPAPTAQVTLTDMGGHVVRVDIEAAEGSTLEYKEESMDIIEHNTLFNDTLYLPTTELLDFAKENYVQSDLVGSVFVTEAQNMDNTWCGMTAEDRCDMTTICDKECFGGNCCCKGMFFDDVCWADMGDGYCESQLSTYCSRNVGGNPCDFNNNGRIDADEKYRCDIQAGVADPITTADGAIEASGNVDECIRVEHNTELGYSRTITVSWTDEVADDCLRINTVGCHCDDRCEGSEANCGDCIGITAGTNLDGRCPSEAPWVDDARPGVDKSVLCPGECCAIEWVCDEWQDVSRCRGTNKASCNAASCDTDCCDYTPECRCDECALEDWCDKNDNDCNFPVNTDCCDGPGDPKSFECDSCCDSGGSQPASCERKSCKDVSKSDCMADECDGCYWDEGDWHHTISLNCRANVCGMPCCEQTDTLYEDVVCDYDYYGTASVDVEVKDVVNEYPIYASWTDLTLSFSVVSGNAAECEDNEPVEESAYVPDTSVCCPALTTNAEDDADGCKSDEIIDFGDEPEPPSCVLDSDCCSPVLSGRRVECSESVCEIIPPMLEIGYLCP